MNRIPEPHELADRHFARLEEERRAMIEDAVCGECNHYYGVPDKWVKTACGYCPIAGEHVPYSDRVIEFDCEDFEPRRP